MRPSSVAGGKRMQQTAFPTGFALSAGTISLLPHAGACHLQLERIMLQTLRLLSLSNKLTLNLGAVCYLLGELACRAE